MSTTTDPNIPILSAAMEHFLKSAELKDTAIGFLKDLDVFLGYIATQARIKLSNVNHTLPLKHMVEVEKQFQKIFKPTRAAEQVYHLEVHFFMATCKALTILRVDAQNYLLLTTYGE